MKQYEYKTVNLYLTPIESDVSQYEIQKKCNELGKDGWELVKYEIHDSTNILLIFKR